MQRGALLQGELAEQVRSALDPLSRSLLELRPARLQGPSLAGGLAGLAIVHATLDRAVPGRGHARRATAMLDGAIDAVATQELSTSLYSGFVGIAWAAELLRGNGGNGDDANEAIDSALIELLEASTERWDGEYDLVSGLVGLGVYALERAKQPGRGQLLAEVVRLLCASAEVREGGLVWISQPEWVEEKYRGTRTTPYVDLGLAHGTPGAIALLAHAVARGVGGSTASATLEGATRWLLAQELEPRAHSRFAYQVVGGAPVGAAARVAWCYGDLAVAWALLLAGRASKRPEWEGDALRVARAAALRPLEHSGVLDAGICHGAAGVAHVLAAFWRATGDAACADAARSWLRRTLEFRRPGPWFAGYFAAWPDRPTRRSDPSVLTGAAGVALALASAVCPEAPGWDRMLLLDTLTEA